MPTDINAELARRAPQSTVSQVTQVEQARAIAEVQAAVVVAQQVPRDLGRAYAEMRDACGRMSLANRAFYRVPKRGEGPSVHLARELARIWGNIDYGVRELRRDDAAATSEIQAFAWDQQANTRSTRTFQVPHQRMKDGKRQALIDLNDVYLNNQNIGARAVRECLYTVMPASFVEEAEDLCRQTLRNGEGVPLHERIDQMVQGFHATFGVKPGQLEAKLGKNRSKWDAGDVASMRVLFTSLQRSEVTVEEEFPTARATADDFKPKGRSKPDTTPDAPTQEPPTDDAADAAWKDGQ